MEGDDTMLGRCVNIADRFEAQTRTALEAHRLMKAIENSRLSLWDGQRHEIDVPVDWTHRPMLERIIAEYVNDDVVPRGLTVDQLGMAMTAANVYPVATGSEAPVELEPVREPMPENPRATVAQSIEFPVGMSYDEVRRVIGMNITRGSAELAHPATLVFTYQPALRAELEEEPF